MGRKSRARAKDAGPTENVEDVAPVAEGAAADADGDHNHDDAKLFDRLMPRSGPATFEVEDIQWVVLPPGGMLSLDETNALDVETVEELSRSEADLDEAVLAYDAPGSRD